MNSISDTTKESGIAAITVDSCALAPETKTVCNSVRITVSAIINKRAGGMGLISGRKAFQRPLKEGVELLNAIQDVYLDKEISVA